ncbi:MAG: FliH/SctL family protein [Polyangiaceae bacterium]
MTLRRAHIFRQGQDPDYLVVDLRPLVGDYRPPTYLRFISPQRPAPPVVGEATNAVARASLVASASELAAGWVRLRQRQEQLDEQVESRVELLAKVIAERLIERELSLSPETIRNLVREVIQALPPGETVRLRAHPIDALELEKCRVELGLGSNVVQIVADPLRTRGSMRAESELGTLDADLSARIDRLLAALREP